MQANCSCHFCSACLLIWCSKTPPSPPIPSTHLSHKCPNCRTPFTTPDIRPDPTFQRLITSARSVPCLYANCTSKLPLPKLKEHEATCPHAPLTCMYRPFGCPWVGPRKDFPHHISPAGDCKLHAVKSLVQLLREGAARHEREVGAIAMNVALQGRQIAQIIHVQEEGREERRKRIWNPVNHVVFFATAMCFPEILTRQAPLWVEFNGE